MRKQVEESTAAESARRATRPAAESDRKGRFSARRTRATVLRLLRGENLESVSRELVLAPFAVDRSAAPLQSWGTRGVSPAGTLEP